MLIARPKTLFLKNLPRLVLAAGGFFVFNAQLSSTEAGVDAVIHGHHKSNPNLHALINELQSNDIQWLRERGSWSDILKTGHTGSDARSTWTHLKKNDFSVLAYVRGARSAESKQYPAIDLGIDLLETYQRAAWMAYSHYHDVDAWELLNEGENVFVHDMPERAAAWEKVLYLGLKAGAHKMLTELKYGQASRFNSYDNFSLPTFAPEAIPAVPILLGAIAGLPGIQYNKVKAENGFQDYADAWNFHHYGWPSNFAELIASHQAFQRTSRATIDLPLWLTEYGNYRGEIRSRMQEAQIEQAAYFRHTTKVAIEKHVAVTMPFIVNWHGMPGFSLFDDNFDPYLPWDAYTATLNSESKRIPSKAVIKSEGRVSPVIMQWVADPVVSVANKHNGAYRFHPALSLNQGWRPMEGTLRVYNFSAEAITGKLNWSITEPFSAFVRHDTGAEDSTLSLQESGQDVTLPSMGIATFHLRLFTNTSKADRFLAGAFSAKFNPNIDIVEGGQKTVPSALLYFPVETQPSWDQFTSIPIKISETSQNLRARPISQRVTGTTVAMDFISQRRKGTKAGSAVSADSNRAISVPHSQSTTPRNGPLGTGGPTTPTHKNSTTPRSGPLGGGPTLPIWIKEDRDPELNRFEDFAEEGKQRFATEKKNIRVHPRSSVVQKTVSLAPVSITQRGLPDWHNRDYPYGYEWTSQSGTWSGFNRMIVEDLGVEVGTFAKIHLKLNALHPHSQKKPRAVCKVVDGLPQDGWIGVIANRNFDATFNLQVFLIDKLGQRWTIDEQLISNPHLPGFEKLLKIADFDKIYFGNIVPGAALIPEDVVEIQLHPHGLENRGGSLEIALSIMRPKEAG